MTIEEQTEATKLWWELNPKEFTPPTAPELQKTQSFIDIIKQHLDGDKKALRKLKRS